MSENYDGNKPIGAFSSLQTYLTYSWINNEYFYSLIPQSYQDYYQRFVKQWFYWYDGFVPYFHNHQSGMVSTGLAFSILKKLAEKTVGNKIMFDDEGVADINSIDAYGKTDLSSLEFTELWGTHNQYTPKVRQAFEWAYAGGDSILKLDSDGKELYLRPMRKDAYLIDTDFRGKICHFMGFVYAYTKLIPKLGSDSDRKIYYVVEEREYNDAGKSMFRMAIKETNGQVTQGKAVDYRVEEVPFDRLPKDIVRKFKKDFPNMKIGEWKEMSIDHLGIYPIKASENVHFLPDAPFGESLLSNLIHILMTYDFYFSSLTTNLYTTRDKVILPQHMQTPMDATYDGQLSGTYGNYNQGLDTFIYNRVPYVNPEEQKPIFIQPELRDWDKIRNNLLQTCAMTLGVDERTVMSASVPNAEKPTAREISVDEDTTASFVEKERELNIHSLNDLLHDMLRFYGFTVEEVKNRFSRAGLTNINNVVTVASIMKQNQLADTKTLVEMIFLDKNEKQIKNIIEALTKEKEEQQEQEIQKNKMNSDVEESIEQQNNTTEYHVPKKKGE